MKISMRQLILAIYSVFISICILSESCFIENEVWTVLLTISRYLTAFVMLLLIFKEGKLNLTKAQMSILSLIVGLGLINLYTTGGGTMPLLIIATILLVYSYHVSFLSLVRSTTVTLAGTSLFIVVMSLFDFIEDRTGTRYTESFFIEFMNRTWTRHALGFLVHNQLPSIILFLYIYRIIYKKDKMTVLEHLIFIILNILLLFICGSRMNFLMFFVVLFSYIIANWKRKRNRKRKRIKSSIAYLWTLYPICFALTIILTIKYNPYNHSWLLLNNILMNRIVMAHLAYVTFGFAPFGINEQSFIKLTIAGINSDSVTLDNGYINSMMYNGTIFTIVILSVWSWLTMKAEKKGYFHLAFVLAILSVVSLIDAHLFSYKLIPLMVLALDEASKNEEKMACCS